MKRALLALAVVAAITVPVGAQFGWFSLNGGLIARMSSAVPAATIEQGGSGAILSLIRRGIGATSTDGSVLRNTTAAAVGAQQYSPRSCWEGQGWKTDATAASQSVVFCMETVPVQGTSAPSGNFILKASINGGAFSTVGTFTSAGALSVESHFTAQGDIQNFGNIYGGTSSFFSFLTRSVVRSNADGNIRIANNNESNTYDITLADWGTTLSAEPVPVANAATLALGTATSGSCTVSYPGDAAIYVLRGTANATRLADGSATFTVTKDNAATVNVYYDTTGYFLQNNTGGTLSFRVACAGG